MLKNVLVENGTQAILLSVEKWIIGQCIQYVLIVDKECVCLPLSFSASLCTYVCIYTHIFVYEQTCAFFNLEETLVVSTEHRSTGLRSDIFIMYMCFIQIYIKILLYAQMNKFKNTAESVTQCCLIK